MPKNFESCQYSEKLLNKLTSLNPLAQNTIDLSEIRKAIYWAKKYHQGQMRDSGEPFYTHPLEVAYMVSDYILNTNIIITAILHDTIEDTPLTFETLRELFNETIANQVMDLTRIKSDGHKISSSEMVESLWLQKKYSLLFIKQFDRLHNIQTIGAKSPEKIIKIIEETLCTFLVLATYLEIPLVKQKLIQLCYRSLGITEQIQWDLSIPAQDDFQLRCPTFQNEISQIRNLYLQES